MSDDNNKTQMDFRAITRDMVDRGIIDEEAAFRLEQGYKRNSLAGKLLENMREYWLRWLLSTLSSGTMIAEFFDIINMVD